MGWSSDLTTKSQKNKLKFSPTWSCVSILGPTIPGGWDYLCSFRPNICKSWCLTLSSPSLLLSSSSTTSRKLMSQFSTCSGWRWLDVGDEWKNILLFLKQFHENLCSKTTRFREIKPFFRDMRKKPISSPISDLIGYKTDTNDNRCAQRVKTKEIHWETKNGNLVWWKRQC